MKKLLTAILAGATVLSGVGFAQVAAAQPGYYRDSPRWHGGYRQSPRYYGHRGYYRDRGSDAATAAIAGALIGGAIVAGSRNDRYYGDRSGYYYDRAPRYSYYDRSYRCYDREVWDPYYGGYIIRQVCR